MKTKHATKKNRLPNIAQKLPILDIINPTAEIINKIHPMKFSFLLDKLITYLVFKNVVIESSIASNHEV